MDFLKTLFPMSFRKSTEVSDLVKRCVIYAVVTVVFGIIVAIIGCFDVPLIAIMLGAVAALVDVYSVAGIALAILVHCNVIKINTSDN